MARGEKLYQFIQRLSANEKRHFRLQYSAQGDKSKYFILFTILDKLKKYDEEEVKKRTQKKGNFKVSHALENYLFNRILESLRSYNEKNSVQTQLYTDLINADILEKKGLYDLSAEILNRAKRLAERHDESAILCEVLQKQVRQTINSKDKKLQQEVDDICQQLTFHAQQEFIEKQYISISQQLFARYRIWKDLNLKEKEEYINSLLAQPLLQNFPTEGTFTAQYKFYNILSVAYTLCNQIHKACEAYEKIIVLWESRPEIIQQNFSLYLIQLANLLSNKINLKHWEEVEVLLQKLEKIKTNNLDEEAEKFQNLYFHRLRYLMNTHQYNKAIELVDDIEAGMLKYKKKINPSRFIMFHFNLTSAYFLTENYDQASNWIDKILQIERTVEIHKATKYFARIYNLAICYSLDSNLMIENMLRGIYRQKEVLDTMSSLEHTILQHFKEIIKVAPKSRAAKNAFQLFLKDLDNLSEQDKNMRGFEEFRIWVTKMSQ